MCGACLMFLMSLASIAALGVIAGGSFWTAQSMYRVTDNQHSVNVKLCDASGGNLGIPALQVCTTVNASNILKEGEVSSG